MSPEFPQNRFTSHWEYVPFLAMALTVLLGLGSLQHAQGNQMRSEEELRQLELKIHRIKSDLKLGREKASGIESEIESLDREVAGILEKQNRYKNEILKLEATRAELHATLENLVSETRSVQEDLASLVRTGYLMGQQDSIKLLLNQEDPTQIAVNMAVYRYIVGSRRSRLHEIRQHRESIEKTTMEIKLRESEIDRLQEDLEVSMISLNTVRDRRHERLAAVQGQISEDQKKVHLYRLREVELRLLLENLQRREVLKAIQEKQEAEKKQAQKKEPEKKEAQPVTKQKPSSAANTFKGGFGKSRGRLAMPAKARIQHRFGDAKPESGLLWEGLMLGVEDGQDVRSIYNGQVVYSDWFRGYGQLLVIDHGGGFMSLYGHNQFLHVELGSEVEAGQLIASAGSSGGLAAPGLYFEIRHNGIPHDPLQWCRL